MIVDVLKIWSTHTGVNRLYRLLWDDVHKEWDLQEAEAMVDAQLLSREVLMRIRAAAATQPLPQIRYSAQADIDRREDRIMDDGAQSQLPVSALELPPSPVAAGGRLECPVLTCIWYVDVPEPKLEQVTGLNITVRGVDRAQVEAVLMDHFNTHTPVEYLATIQKLARRAPQVTPKQVEQMAESLWAFHFRGAHFVGTWADEREYEREAWRDKARAGLRAAGISVLESQG